MNFATEFDSIKENYIQEVFTQEVERILELFLGFFEKIKNSYHGLF